jgi:hypothetical protein
MASTVAAARRPAGRGRAAVNAELRAPVARRGEDEVNATAQAADDPARWEVETCLLDDF